MHREPFDTLTRVVASNPSRRHVLAAMLSVLLGHAAPVRAEPGTAKGKGHTKDRGAGHEKQEGQGHASDALCPTLACEQFPVPVGEPPEFCCKGGVCSCGGDCCDEKSCFQIGPADDPERVFCCTGPKLVICGTRCCKDSCDACDLPGQSGYAGSYRRR